MVARNFLSGLISKWNKTIYGLQLALITAKGNLLKNVLQCRMQDLPVHETSEFKNVTRIRELKKCPYKLR